MMKNKLINIEKLIDLLKLIIIVICLIFNLLIFIVGRNLNISIIGLFFSLIIIIIFFVYDKMYELYNIEMLAKLSDMLSQIINMNNKEVFTEIDDSMFSKLQYQTLRVSKILKSQNDKITKEKEEIKSLISDIAHQLKTPLSNMKIYSEFLQDETLDEKQKKEFNEIILLSLNKLIFLVESMIKMSRLESSIIKINKQKNDLNETILGVIKQLYKNASLKEISIKFEPKEKINIFYDKKWTSEAIFNILDNAIKYSRTKSEIFINIEKYEMFTRINIKDQGIGIKEEEIPKIFMRFYRGKDVLDKEGVGIGLYLSRKIITQQNGYIKVNSNDSGSIFSIFLPNTQ